MIHFFSRCFSYASTHYLHESIRIYFTGRFLGVLAVRTQNGVQHVVFARLVGRLQASDPVLVLDDDRLQFAHFFGLLLELFLQLVNQPLQLALLQTQFRR